MFFLLRSPDTLTPRLRLKEEKLLLGRKAASPDPDPVLGTVRVGFSVVLKCFPTPTCVAMQADQPAGPFKSLSPSSLMVVDWDNPRRREIG
jgi:hypothetical protein